MTVTLDDHGLVENGLEVLTLREGPVEASLFVGEVAGEGWCSGHSTLIGSMEDHIQPRAEQLYPSREEALRVAMAAVAGHLHRTDIAFGRRRSDAWVTEHSRTFWTPRRYLRDCIQFVENDVNQMILEAGHCLPCYGDGIDQSGRICRYCQGGGKRRRYRQRSEHRG